MGDPTKTRCFCRPGYRCPHCERERQRKAEYEAERRRVEKLLGRRGDGGDGDDE